MIVIGKFVKAHGLNGMLKTIVYLDYIEDLLSHKVMLGALPNTVDSSIDLTVCHGSFKETESPVIAKYEDTTLNSIKILTAAWHRDNIALIKCEGVNNIADVKRVIGQYLLIEESVLPPLPEDTYYHHELLNMTVIRNGETIGTVKAVNDFGGGNVITVTNGEMLLMLDEFIENIDKKANTILAR
jgi:16S rRNA processing protein RimM